MGVVIDWSDAEAAGLKLAVGEHKAAVLLKGCKVHWQRSCHIKQPDISIRNTLNYQNNCRNTFGWLVGLSDEAAKLDILIISLVCRW